jgi:hypothetical protein
MRLHSLIFPPKLSETEANKIATYMTKGEQPFRSWLVNDWFRIGYTAPGAPSYKSLTIDFLGTPVTVVFERVPGEPLPFKKGVRSKYILNLNGKDIAFGAPDY